LKRKKIFAVIGTVLLCAALFAGCNSEEANLSSQETEISSSVKTEVSSKAPASSEVSSKTPSETESTVSETEELSSLPEGEVTQQTGEETAANQLPEITFGDSAFQEAFLENPIDKAFQEKLKNATSLSLTLQAYQDVQTLWSAGVDTAYQALLNTLETEEDKAALQAEQEAWTEDFQEKKDAAAAAQDQTQALENTRELMEFCRDRAAQLSAQVFETTGALPSFSADLSQAQQAQG
jgi:hypothetical protein